MGNGNSRSMAGGGSDSDDGEVPTEPSRHGRFRRKLRRYRHTSNQGSHRKQLADGDFTGIACVELLGAEMESKDKWFACVSLGERTYRTPKSEHTDKPVWNSKKKVVLEKGGAHIARISLYQTTIISKNNLIGYCEINLSPLSDKEEYSTEETFNLFDPSTSSKVVGSITVQIFMEDCNEIEKSFARRVLDIVDYNDDGKLQFSEFSELMDAFGNQHAASKKKELFNKADTNGDGFVSLDELADLLASSNEKEPLVSSCPVCGENLSNFDRLNAVIHLTLCFDEGTGNQIMTGGFLTEKQASKRWMFNLSEWINFSSYDIGLNSGSKASHIVVFDRRSKRLVEELIDRKIVMSMRALYQSRVGLTLIEKGVKDLLQSLSEKQGRKMDSPESAENIPKFLDVFKMDPGPNDRSVLWGQDRHRSQYVWDGRVNHWLTCRRREAILRHLQVDARVATIVQQAGLGSLLRIPFISLDWHLITTLVERWRPETHTFHMHHGEMTITLQDVSVILGLPVGGIVVTGSTSRNWGELCTALLGIRPARMKGARIPLKWLENHFSIVPVDADETTVRQFARAYILMLLGGIVFPDKSNSLVSLSYLQLLNDLPAAGRYSWGSACLAFLFRHMCRASTKTTTQIGGCLILLQIWAWEHFPHIAPVVPQRPQWADGPLAMRWAGLFQVTENPANLMRPYRDAFDIQSEEQVIWMPYTDEIMALIPPAYVQDPGTWLCRVPLIYFHIVEHIYPDRVIRQFGGIQTVPLPCDTDRGLHTIDLRGKKDVDWTLHHQIHITDWIDRHSRRVAVTPPTAGGPLVSDDYMTWYKQISRRCIRHHGQLLWRQVEHWDEVLMSCIGHPEYDHFRVMAENARRELEGEISRQFRDIVIDDEDDDEEGPAGRRGGAPDAAPREETCAVEFQTLEGDMEAPAPDTAPGAPFLHRHGEENPSGVLTQELPIRSGELFPPEAVQEPEQDQNYAGPSRTYRRKKLRTRRRH